VNQYAIDPAGDDNLYLCKHIKVSDVYRTFVTDVFKGAFSPKHWTAQTLPMVHCYLFAKTVETSEDIIQRSKHHLGGDLLEPIVHNVRDVAPNKHMYCLSFKISAEVAFATENDPRKELVKGEEIVTDGEDCAVDAKRQRVD
jgi:hypothetical protein